MAKNTEENIICMCVDIRNSTNLHEKTKSLKTTKNIIKSFIEEVYKCKNINNTTNKFLYAGDGIMFIYKLNNQDSEKFESKKVFSNFLNLADEVEKLIIDFEKKYKNYDFKAGIALDYGKSIETSLENIPKGNGKTDLYVGYPVSRSTKICKTMPIEWPYKSQKIRYIGLSKSFYDELEDWEKGLYKLTNSKKKAMKND